MLSLVHSTVGTFGLVYRPLPAILDVDATTHQSKISSRTHVNTTPTIRIETRINSNKLRRSSQYQEELGYCAK